MDKRKLPTPDHGTENKLDDFLKVMEEFDPVQAEAIRKEMAEKEKARKEKGSKIRSGQSSQQSKATTEKKPRKRSGGATIAEIVTANMKKKPKDLTDPEAVADQVVLSVEDAASKALRDFYREQKRESTWKVKP